MAAQAIQSATPSNQVINSENKSKCLIAYGMRKHIQAKIKDNAKSDAALNANLDGLIKWSAKVYTALNSEFRFQTCINWGQILDNINDILDQSSINKY